MKLKFNDLQKIEIVPEGWTQTTLGEILPIKYGKGLTKEKRDETGSFPVLGSSGIVGNHGLGMTTEPSLIIGRKGSVGEVYYSKLPCWPIDTVYFAEGSDAIELKYFFYFLKGLNLSKLDKSTTIPGLSRDDYNAVEVLVAPLGQQKRIVGEIEKQFSRLDEAVTNLKRVQANLKRYKEAVLKAAVEGKLTEDWRKTHPDVEPARQLLKRLLADRRKNWKGRGTYKEPVSPNIEGFLALPNGWIWASLDQLFLNITDGDHQPPPQTESGVPFLVIGNVRSGKIDFKDTRFVSRDYADKVDLFRKPKMGDILYTVTGSFGIAVPVTNNREFCIQRHIGILRPFESTPTDFLVLVLNSPFVFHQAATVATGTAQLTVPISGLRRFAIPLPPLAEQTKIVTEISHRLGMAEKLDEIVSTNIQRANNLRQTILHQAFSGKLVPQDPDDEPVKWALDKAMKTAEGLPKPPKPRKKKEITAMPKEMVGDLEELLGCLKKLGGSSSPERLLGETGLGDDVEKFFDLLREGKKNGSLIVPVGESGQIRRGKSAN